MKRLLFSSALLQVKKQETPAAPDAKAAADIEKAGGAVRTLAQNDERLEVSFQLQGASITDKELALIAGLKKVAQLNLARTSVTDEGLRVLSTQPGLTHLHLELTKISDAGLVHLKTLRELEYLNLYGTGVSDAGLSNLSGLTNLKNLYLWQTKVSPEGVKKLKEALPKLAVNVGWDSAAPAKP
ncbi:MAG TPA: hypothetical protein VFQ91_04330 [Bryobacteraceae bacterium]|nr:hypothetical protein [Bryobacteraceae bacterium]